MLYRLNENIQQYLLSQPEHGMGYQIVHRNDSGDRLIIFNSEFSISTEHIAGYFDHDRMLIAENQDLESLTMEPENLTVISHGSYSSMSRKDELFVRFSAFRNDRRIRADGSIESGSYVTTENDARYWRHPFGCTGLSAVARYALPNPDPAINVFLLQPSVSVPISCGTVAPDYGQAGGGVEVRFNSATPAGTLIDTITIPDR